jgi:hypothetical protein
VSGRNIVELRRVHRANHERATEGEEFTDPIVGFESRINALRGETVERSVESDQLDIRFGNDSLAHAGDQRSDILIRPQAQTTLGLLRVAEDHGCARCRDIIPETGLRTVAVECYVNASLGQRQRG